MSKFPLLIAMKLCHVISICSD